ncbi:MAG: hypothetical protein ACJAR1_000948 [Rubritalea sp.]|jgi:hypothetical protein
MPLLLQRDFYLTYLLFLGLFSLFHFSSCDHKKLTSIEFTNGDISQEVYVWQRIWTDEVKSAVMTHAPEFDHTVFLAAEISYLGGEWTCQPFPHPLQHAREHPGEYGLAFRIHANSAKSRWSESASEQISQFLTTYAGDAKSIQIDYDCPSKKLADYTKLLIHLKNQFPDKTIEITCLPDWLNYPEFAALLQQTGLARYIMQVHGVSGHGKGRALCNPDHAHKTALACAELGKPFLIALPTYRHAINYGQDGTVLSIASEGHYQQTSYEVASADPFQLSLLIQRWQEQRPMLMQGIIWYRLPVSTDRMNWTWDTFQKVRHGEYLTLAELDLAIITTKDGLQQLMMTNNSKQRLDWPLSIRLDWQGFCIASHLTDHFSTEQFERSKGITIQWKKTSPYPIAPGETVHLGSFRFNENAPSIKISTP